MRRPSRWTQAWIAWLIVFVMVEVPAAVRKQTLDTLSENVWAWFGVKGGRPYSRARRIVLGVFMAVLTSHFVFGWPGGVSIIATGLPVAVVILYSLVRE